MDLSKQNHRKCLQAKKIKQKQKNFLKVLQEIEAVASVLPGDSECTWPMQVTEHRELCGVGADLPMTCRCCVAAPYPSVEPSKILIMAPPCTNPSSRTVLPNMCLFKIKMKYPSFCPAVT